MGLGNQVPDKNLLKSVNQKLIQRSGGSGSKVTASVVSGTVTLTGTLAQEYQRKTIISSMQQVSGVRRVVDQMQVAPPRKREQ
jgi:osmotically-inducible protein OsmY